MNVILPLTRSPAGLFLMSSGFKVLFDSRCKRINFAIICSTVSSTYACKNFPHLNSTPMSFCALLNFTLEPYKKVFQIIHASAIILQSEKWKHFPGFPILNLLQ